LKVVLGTLLYCLDASHPLVVLVYSYSTYHRTYVNHSAKAGVDITGIIRSEAKQIPAKARQLSTVNLPGVIISIHTMSTAVQEPIQPVELGAVAGYGEKNESMEEIEGTFVPL
jgi:hypothetical protein